MIAPQDSQPARASTAATEEIQPLAPIERRLTRPGNGA